MQESRISTVPMYRGANIIAGTQLVVSTSCALHQELTFSLNRRITIFLGTKEYTQTSLCGVCSG
jgi:hypothetical protein